MSQDHIFCSGCGARNDGEATYCSSCGSRLGAPGPVSEAAAPPPPPVEYARVARGEPIKKANSLPLLLALGAIVVLLAVVLIEAVVILLPRGSGPGGGAILSVRQGEVFVQRGAQSGWMAVAEDFALQTGDRIRTSQASYAVLDFLDGTSTEVAEMTVVTIDGLELARDTRVVIKLDLEVGEIWNRVAALPADSLHEVTTLAAAVTCHGSEYGVAVNEAGTTWVTGQEGRVEVTAGGSTVAVAPGDTLMVEIGSPPVSFGSVAMVPTVPVEETSGEMMTSVEGADMPTFLNQPIPTGTPTNTPLPTSTPRPVQPSPTATTRPRPTATTPICPANCPTWTINVPSGAPPRLPFLLEWDPGSYQLPSGWQFALEFSQDPSPSAAWSRAIPISVFQEGGHWKAELHGPGEGTWYWRVCISRSQTAPSCCCGPTPPHTIVHERDDSC
ncbi:MAG TPA: hypothetical protein ENO24_05055 [Chloroflexi bacterium]|nr:hypothetical protein [Chloroflexota bacterium]